MMLAFSSRTRPRFVLTSVAAKRPTIEPLSSPYSDGACRYAASVTMPDGTLRYYLEVARPDGAHDLVTLTG